MGTAHDWQMRMDQGKQLRFPKDIVESTLGQDILLVPETSKQVVMLELMVLWEE